MSSAAESKGLLGLLGFESPSFVELLRREQAGLLPSFPLEGAPQPSAIPHGTTVLALRYSEGVVMGGDRRAIEGFQVSSRRIDKVYRTDAHSAMAIAGAAGPCIEMARLFQTELEHYEKIEGEELALDGKANKLAQMIKMNLPMAIQGLVVIPIYAGYDLKKAEGRIFKYDVAGGKYEEDDYYATGSGGKDARNSLKKLYRPGLGEKEAIRVGLEAILDAAEDDLGTGGPDLVRGIYPNVMLVKAEGILDVPEAEVQILCEEITAQKKAQIR
ncbi:MAG: proteasome subunit beta [Deltaproteobacteria bacterium]|nr:proteasome subunit beta [Deltaproteobacteria bacterium]